ncbi:MAG: fibronectin type III domain-containing protein, partial [Alphaproteobacteria bacterium]|nr:fibronectin type III domain-containing protein [Alphaproteobacteria bacterium]
WPDTGAALAGTGHDGRVKLTWSPAKSPDGAVAGYDIYRADEHGEVRCVEAVKGCRYVDRLALSGQQYRYFVRAFDHDGRPSPASETIAITMAMTEHGAK